MKKLLLFISIIQFLCLISCFENPNWDEQNYDDNPQTTFKGDGFPININLKEDPYSEYINNDTIILGKRCIANDYYDFQMNVINETENTISLIYPYTKLDDTLKFSIMIQPSEIPKYDELNPQTKKYIQLRVANSDTTWAPGEYTRILTVFCKGDIEDSMQYKIKINFTNTKEPGMTLFADYTQLIENNQEYNLGKVSTWTPRENRMRILNTGESDLIITSISIIENSKEFSLINQVTMPLTLKSWVDQQASTDETTQIFQLRFNPTAGGIHTGKLKIVTNDPQATNFIVPLKVTVQ